MAYSARGAKPQTVSQMKRAESASNKALLYISEAANEIDIVSYPKGKPVASISGVYEPEGMCSDAQGNVFVTSAAGEILEYAHGGTTPIATLSDSGYEPTDCSVDSLTGDLAVANFGPGSSGNVAIYRGATGTPNFYADPDFDVYYACAYDDSGNLFVVGINGTANFSELLQGGSALKSLTLPLPNPRGIKWDGTYLAIESLSATSATINRISVSGSTVQVIRTVPFTWKKRKKGVTLFYFAFDKQTLVGPFSNEVGLWAYPKGGNAQNVLRGFPSAQGVAISTP